MGIGQITLADRGRQLQQYVERWAFRVEFEQRPVEREHEHRLPFRLPFEPEGKVQGLFPVQVKGKGSIPVPVETGRIDVAINAVSTEHEAGQG